MSCVIIMHKFMKDHSYIILKNTLKLKFIINNLSGYKCELNIKVKGNLLNINLRWY